MVALFFSFFFFCFNFVLSFIVEFDTQLIPREIYTYIHKKKKRKYNTSIWRCSSAPSNYKYFISQKNISFSVASTSTNNIFYNSSWPSSLKDKQKKIHYFWPPYITIEAPVGPAMVASTWTILTKMGLVWSFLYSLFFLVLEYKYASTSRVCLCVNQLLFPFCF